MKKMKNEKLLKLIKENPDLDIIFVGDEDESSYYDYICNIEELYYVDFTNSYVLSDEIVEYLEVRIDDYYNELKELNKVPYEKIDEEILKWANKNLEHSKVILLTLFN